MSVSAETNGPGSTSFEATTRSFFTRKKKSSPCGPKLPWDVPMRGLCAQTHTVHVLKRAKPFLTKVCPTTLAPYLNPLGRRSFTTASSQQSALIQILHALQMCVQRCDLVFEMFFPQLQSRLIPSQDVVFSCRLIKLFISTVFGCLHSPQRLCLLTLTWFFWLQLPYTFLCSDGTALPTHFPLQCSYALSLTLRIIASASRGV